MRPERCKTSPLHCLLNFSNLSFPFYLLGQPAGLVPYTLAVLLSLKLASMTYAVPLRELSAPRICATTRDAASPLVTRSCGHLFVLEMCNRNYTGASSSIESILVFVVWARKTQTSNVFQRPNESVDRSVV